MFWARALKGRVAWMVRHHSTPLTLTHRHTAESQPSTTSPPSVLHHFPTYNRFDFMNREKSCSITWKNVIENQADVPVFFLLLSRSLAVAISRAPEKLAEEKELCTIYICWYEKSRSQATAIKWRYTNHIWDDGHHFAILVSFLFDSRYHAGALVMLFNC